MARLRGGHGAARRRSGRAQGRALSPIRVVWPESAAELEKLQCELAACAPEAWQPEPGPLRVGGVFVCFERGRGGAGADGDPGWAGAAIAAEGRRVAAVGVAGAAAAPYAAGLLALREGRLLETAVRALPERPDVLLVNATGRDHPRRAGLALHLGARLGMPTVGVTHRPLFASGGEPAESLGSRSPLWLDGEMVGVWLRVRPGVRPLAVHAGWRCDVACAIDVVIRAVGRARTPLALRIARAAARELRARSASSADHSK
ncbi:MAG: endonuclease V [Deltaproteobacteria bacterium]|nr:endonuclease V [Deltaproteobacteria bacterium]